jgi:hypothetical protein
MGREGLYGDGEVSPNIFRIKKQIERILNRKGHSYENQRATSAEGGRPSKAP